MPRDVGHISDPLPIRLYEIDEVATDVPTRNRDASEFEPPDSPGNGRDQEAMDIPSQRNLRLGAKVARPVAPGEVRQHNEAGRQEHENEIGVGLHAAVQRLTDERRRTGRQEVLGAG